MERIDSQLELFSKSGLENNNGLNAKRPFLSYIKGSEKLIILIIAFIVTGVVSFSFGVEKGRRIEARKSDSRLDLALQPKLQPAPGVKVSRQQPAVQIPAVIRQEAVKPVERENLQNYTIQVASYKSKIGAQKEAERLKKQGLSTLVLSKGKYVVLCIGKYPNKEMANRMLAELVKKYKGCIIRRL